MINKMIASQRFTKKAIASLNPTAQQMIDYNFGEPIDAFTKVEFAATAPTSEEMLGFNLFSASEWFGSAEFMATKPTANQVIAYTHDGINRVSNDDFMATKPTREQVARFNTSIRDKIVMPPLVDRNVDYQNVITLSSPQFQVFHNGTSDKVVVVSNTHAVEVVSRTRSAFLPKISVLRSREAFVYGCDNMYTMPHYRPLIDDGKLNDEHYVYYRLLKQLIHELDGIVSAGDLHLYDSSIEVIERFGLPSELEELMLDMFSGMSVKGFDVLFSMSPERIAATDNGELVLVDCFSHAHQQGSTVSDCAIEEAKSINIDSIDAKSTYTH